MQEGGSGCSSKQKVVGSDPRVVRVSVRFLHPQLNSQVQEREHKQEAKEQLCRRKQEHDSCNYKWTKSILIRKLYTLESCCGTRGIKHFTG